MFHTKRGGYELVWECCVFNETSEFDNEETDREYSEFRNNFDGDLQLNPRHSRVNSIWDGKGLKEMNKRSTSAESSSFRNSSINDDGCQGRGVVQNKRVRDDSSSPQRSQFGKENHE